MLRTWKRIAALHAVSPGQPRRPLRTGALFYRTLQDDDYADEIATGLEQKLDALVRHELYAKYKTAPTEEEREKARQEYLDERGVRESFRW